MAANYEILYNHKGKMGKILEKYDVFEKLGKKKYGE